MKNKTPKIKIKLKRSQKLTKIGQIIYLTCTNFGNNNLLESASACSFGFIFSFVPLALIIPTRTVKIIKVSGTKENIKPKEQAEALSKRLLPPKFVQVR